MTDKQKRNWPSRRNALLGLGATAGSVAAGGMMINPASAQDKPKNFDKGLDDMARAARELYGLDKESIKRHERKVHFDAFQKVDEQFAKNQAGLPRDSDYRQKLGDNFGVFGNWNTDKGKIFEEYLQEWLGQRKKK